MTAALLLEMPQAAVVAAPVEAVAAAPVVAAAAEIKRLTGKPFV